MIDCYPAAIDRYPYHPKAASEIVEKADIAAHKYWKRPVRKENTTTPQKVQKTRARNVIGDEKGHCRKEKYERIDTNEGNTGEMP